MNTEIIAITDRSFSMKTIGSAVIAGFNRFLAEQQALAGEARLTHVQFNDQYELLYQGVALAQAVPLGEETYVPAGGTALHDAIGRTLDEVGRRIHDEQWADNVIVAITTDGEDNASRAYSPEQVNAMIAHARAHGWHFVFLAANQDAFKAAARYGIPAATTGAFTASAAGATEAYATISAMTRCLREEPAGSAQAA